MAQNADNIEVLRPKTDGVAYTGVAGTTLPVTASETLDEALSSLGLISEDGITMKINRETEDLKEMGGDVALTIQTEHSVEFTLKPMELMNQTVLAEMFGEGNLALSGGKLSGLKVNGDELPERVGVFDMVGRNKRLMRVVVPRLQASELGEIVFKGGEYAASEITYKALPDADGVKAYIYFATAV